MSGMIPSCTKRYNGIYATPLPSPRRDIWDWFTWSLALCLYGFHRGMCVSNIREWIRYGLCIIDRILATQLYHFGAKSQGNACRYPSSSLLRAINNQVIYYAGFTGPSEIWMKFFIFYVISVLEFWDISCERAVRGKSLGLNYHNIGSSNGSVPSGNKRLPEPMLTQIDVAIWRHYDTISQ